VRQPPEAIRPTRHVQMVRGILPYRKQKTKSDNAKPLDEQVKTHGLKLLRSVCRAASHGRMPNGMRRRYEGLLRDLRPHVMALHRSGDTVPPDVLSEVDRIRSESKRGRRA
jgi:hypothetical protein